MVTGDPEREGAREVRRGRWESSALVANEGLATFRRAYRWFNLTLLQHGVWPLLVVVFAAPAAPVALTPLPWYWARLGAPLLAAVLAWAFLAQRPRGCAGEAASWEETTGERERRLRQQVRLLIVGVTVSVALLRLVQGPLVPVLKLEAFGLADAAAFQAINFGVAGRAGAGGPGRVAPVVLFALSWGLRDLFAAAASPAVESVALSFASGAVIGLLLGAVSWRLRRWPGGSVPATMFQFLIVSLTLGFLW